jgi:hypothetical protein
MCILAIDILHNLDKLTGFSHVPVCAVGAATIRATQHIINASYNQRQRFFHLSPEPRML